ncbi:MAG: ABATE domain-containing protein [Pseudomonas sp.]|jgi:predicted RNA-binding Zn ribbon-like protein|uniref:CGNR zinc finger domain-containing protein n=1 Tax=unclassified Pseudomonas TaxID=196821 RepID=UPI0015A09985|nr:MULTISPECIES: ABATE domain-containing protein [unclassified Pseudomonas]MDP9058623.1 ABATE domain-containing protein [Pseudomonadota bacterium]MDE1908885.1 ABATE domain-containing protein [Pseudomonas sp.]MDE2035037.1 ABATE domain-containing protein [Pseudomonas sp.]MDE2189322.1 ABATE domain-containing protein [Pseudomonas sp.]MDE2558155.1 ABATE domain-containing protein [Pseudomonas sp.]
MPAITPSPLEPYVLADHPVLDMLNTRANVDGVPFEFWQGDADVERWLVRLGWAEEGAVPVFEEGALLGAARGLREVIRVLLEQRKAGQQGDPAALNAFLRKAVSHPQLAWPAPGELRLERQRKVQTAEQFLAPIAEAAATLLVEGDFGLVRTCEHPECVLWFYDRTKGHKRRWCSMALCGNRHKVAEFRKRKLV